MTITWTSDLATGIEEIDRQHQEIFKAIDDLLSALRHGRGKGEVGKVIAFLEGYVTRHFALEERAMIQAAYGPYAEHKREHTDFVKEFKELRAAHERQGTSSVLAIDLTNRLCTWLRSHILRTDRSLAQFLQARNPAA